MHEMNHGINSNASVSRIKQKFRFKRTKNAEKVSVTLVTFNQWVVRPLIDSLNAINRKKILLINNQNKSEILQF